MASPEFETLDDVEYGVAEQVSPLVRRVLANNPSKFTYRGTGTYVVGRGDVVVIDPGPELDAHRDALGAAIAGERVQAILITHCHSDHSPLARWLSAETGAPTIAYGPHPRPDPRLEPRPEPQVGQSDAGDESSGDASTGDASTGDEVVIEEATDFDFDPDERVVDGAVVASGSGVTMRAVHTPGHTSNHTCWTLEEESTLFTGDHVMGWSTTVVSPPDGDMAAYIESLERVAGRDDSVLRPTHGPHRDDARRYVASLVEHRLAREAAVLDAVRAGRGTAPEIVELLYADVRPELHKPAARSVWAHLTKLVGDGRVAVDGSAGLATLDATYRAV